MKLHESSNKSVIIKSILCNIKRCACCFQKVKTVHTWCGCQGNRMHHSCRTSRPHQNYLSEGERNLRRYRARCRHLPPAPSEAGFPGNIIVTSRESHGVWDHWQFGRLLNSFFRPWTKTTSQVRVAKRAITIEYNAMFKFRDVSCKLLIHVLWLRHWHCGSDVNLGWFNVLMSPYPL